MAVLEPGLPPHRLEPLLGREAIAEAVHRLARQVEEDYRDRFPLLIGVLKGAFIFLADLARALTIPHQVEFVRLASYGMGTRPGRVRITARPLLPLEGRHLLVVEDIVDTGHSLRALLPYLERRRPASLRVCALLDKPERREVEVPIHYLGFQVPDRFLVGYGLDWAERYRTLPDIYAVEFLPDPVG